MPVCERAISIFPNIKNYCLHVKPKPTIYSFDSVEKALNDCFLLSKLQFFKAVACDFESFLRLFQDERPLAPFLYEFLMSLMKNLLKRFVSSKVVLETGSNYKKMRALNLSSDSPNLKQSTDVDIGFGAKREISKSAHPGQKLEFYRSCKEFLIAVTKKLMERSPLNHDIIRGLSALSPINIMNQSTAKCEKRFSTVLDKLLDSKQLTVTEADKAKQEYSAFISSGSIQRQMRGFDVYKDRLDSLYVKLIRDDPDFSNLWIVCRKVFVLFHGQAAVERGFSVNNDILVENLREDSIIAQRQIYNAIQFYGGVLKVPLTEKLFLSVRGASARRKLAIEKLAASRNADDDVNRRKRQFDDEILSLEHQKSLLDGKKGEIDERVTELKRLKLAL